MRIQTHFDGKMLVLGVRLRESIADLKISIEELTDIPPELQRLTLNGTDFEDHLSLTECDIKDESVLNLHLRLVPRDLMIIFVSTPCKKFSLKFDPNRTIAEVKEEIMKKEGLSVHDYSLYFIGKYIRSNFCTLESYGIKMKDTISLTSPGGEYQVYVKIYGDGKKPFTLCYSSTDSIECVKKRIEIIKGFPASEIRLQSEGRELVDGRTLSSYNIPMWDTVYLLFRLRGS